jgi:hypothetical protein
VFPICHINRYRQCTFIDINNTLQRGCNAVYSGTGHDKSTFTYLASSLEEYLAEIYNSLRYNRHQLYADGSISVFREDPLELGGSSTITSGIKLDAQAHIQVLLCKFDKNIYENVPKFCFVYQIRLSVVHQAQLEAMEALQNSSGSTNEASRPQTLQGFRPCKLLVSNTRHYYNIRDIAHKVIIFLSVL